MADENVPKPDGILPGAPPLAARSEAIFAGAPAAKSVRVRVSGSHWVGLSVISVAGVTTVCLLYFVLWHKGPKPGYPTLTGEIVEQLALFALPTVLFLVAALISWRSIKMQRAVTVVAVLAGVVCAGVTSMELYEPYQASRTGPGTGFLSLMSWALGLVMSVVVFLIAAWRSFREACHRRLHV
jgi:hypothetical protein